MARTTIDFTPMLIEAAMLLFVFTGLVAAALGLLMLLTPAGFERLSKIVGRRFSARQLMKPLEVPHYREVFFYRHHRWTGGLILAGALFFLLSLSFRFDLETASAVLPGNEWVWTSVFWFLVVGNIVALAIGAMILLRPHMLEQLEKSANRWVSLRQISRPLEKSHDAMDHMASRHPKVIGAVLLVAGLFLATTFGLLLAS